MASTILSDNGVSSGSAGIKTTADSTGALALQTTTAGGAATTALTIDTSQNVGIGTASPSQKLDVTNGSAAANCIIKITNSGTWGAYMQGVTSNRTFSYGAFDSTNGFASGSWGVRDETAAAWRMIIDNSGNVGIGTASPASRLNIATGASASCTMRFTSNGTGTGAGDRGRLDFYSADNSGTAYQLGYMDYDRSDGTGTASYIAWANRVSGTVAERMRIDSSGNLLVGATSAPAISGVATNSCIVSSSATGNWQLGIQNTSSSGGPRGVAVQYSAQAPNGTASEPFFFTDNAAYRFSVRSNGGIANYSANNVNISDRREKANFAPAKSYLDVICAIPVQTFNYIDQNTEEDPGLTLGVVAQDVQAVAPELVMESDWSSEKDGSKVRLSIYQTDLQYALMKCIQEQQATITSLTARITALENKT